ncbi:MAG: hypothetical protein V4568_10430 [Pseudomonadota bacterium]
MNTVQAMEMQSTVARRPYLTAVSWGAIFAGVVVGLSLNLVLNLLGIAAGLMTVDVANNPSSVSNAPIVAAVWNAISMLIAAFAGGYVAARMSGLKRKSDGILHGFVSWGATTILLTGLLAAAAGALSNQLFSGIGRGITQSAMSSTQSGGGDFGRQVQALTRGSGGASANNVDARTLQQLQRSVQSGDRQQAISLMVNSMGMDSQRASTVVDQLLILSGSPESASSEGRAAANQAVNTASGVTWGIVVAVGLSLLLGLIGGAVGAAGSRRLPQPHHHATVTTTR